MSNHNNEDVKVIKYNPNNIDEDQKNDLKSDMKTENPNEVKPQTFKKRNSRLKAQRTKAPKVYLQNLKNEKKGGFSLFCSCLGSNKDDDDDD